MSARATRSARVLRTTPVHFASNTVLMTAVDEQVGHAFVGDGRSLHMLDTSSGRMLRTISLHWSTFAVDERRGRLLVVDADNGTMSVLDTGHGSVVHTVPVGTNPGIPAIDAPTGLVFIPARGVVDRNDDPLGPGTVSVVNARTGTTIRVGVVGVNPNGITFDDRTSHAIVINAGGTVSVPDRWAWLPREIRRKVLFLPPPAPRTHTAPASISLLDTSRL